MTVTQIIASLFIIILSPIVLIITIINFGFNGGKVFFKQTRLGKKKEHFTILKLRTMTDGKITSFGKVLRNLGLDELPQLINIVRGEMNFIGPRALTICDVKRLGWNDKHHFKRWSVKPGITGLAQLSPVCNKKLSWQKDSFYVDNNNFKLNLLILIQSLLIPIFGKKKLSNLNHK